MATLRSECTESIWVLELSVRVPVDTRAGALRAWTIATPVGGGTRDRPGGRLFVPPGSTRARASRRRRGAVQAPAPVRLPRHRPRRFTRWKPGVAPNSGHRPSPNGRHLVTRWTGRNCGATAAVENSVFETRHDDSSRDIYRHTPKLVRRPVGTTSTQPSPDAGGRHRQVGRQISQRLEDPFGTIVGHR
jgi:hypothetical protein